MLSTVARAHGSGCAVVPCIPTSSGPPTKVAEPGAAPIILTVWGTDAWTNTHHPGRPFSCLFLPPQDFEKPDNGMLSPLVR